MESYNYFLSGFVKEVGAKGFSNICLLVGRSSHSQKLSENPPTTWVLAEIGGKVLSAHCNRMSGLGEASSHIGAILFYCRAATEKKVTVTGEKAYWVLPSNREVSYKEVSDIDFSCPNTSKTYAPGPEKKIKEVPSSTPTEIELQYFFCKLNLSKIKPAILSLVPPYNVQYKPKSIQDVYPQVLSELYEPECISLNYRGLLVKSKELTFTVSVSQQAAVESATRKQSASRVWFRFRTGHITASKMHSILHTNSAMPSISLIKSICYPESYRFSVEATKWGCQHEKLALDAYRVMKEKQHLNLRMVNYGLFISTDDPFIGAAPDSLISCDCCGEGCVEVKCPYCIRNNTIDEAPSNCDPKFCIQSGYPYYAQIQTQMNVCNRKYCDFFMRTEKDYFCQRVMQDKDIWKTYVEKAELVFRNGVLPEIIGKCFTRVLKVTVYDNNEGSQFCYCKGEVIGEMYPCSRAEC